MGARNEILKISPPFVRWPVKLRLENPDVTAGHKMRTRALQNDDAAFQRPRSLSEAHPVSVHSSNDRAC